MIILFYFVKKGGVIVESLLIGGKRRPQLELACMYAYALEKQ